MVNVVIVLRKKDGELYGEMIPCPQAHTQEEVARFLDALVGSVECIDNDTEGIPVDEALEIIEDDLGLTVPEGTKR